MGYNHRVIDNVDYIDQDVRASSLSSYNDETFNYLTEDEYFGYDYFDREQFEENYESF